MADILDEINAGIQLTIRGKTLHGDKMPLENNTVFVDGTSLILNGLAFTLKNAAAKTSLEEYLSRGTVHVCKVINSDDEGNFLARVMFFAGTPIELGDIQLFVDPKKETIKGDWKDLAEESSFELKGEKYFIIQASTDEVTYKDSQREGFQFSVITTKQNLDIRTLPLTSGYYCDVIRAFKR